MASRRIYTKYKMLIHALGLKQVDVYRVSDNKGALRDVVRIVNPLTNTVAVIDLGTVREALSFTEFLEKVIGGLEKAGVSVSERQIAAAREKARALDESLSAATAQSG